MKKVMIAVVSLAFLATAACAAQAKKYQVTGSVVEVTADKIVVQKADEKWEIARDKETSVEGDVKAGEKVTVEYTMKAKSIEVKPAKAK